jgi:hypothetical protein
LRASQQLQALNRRRVRQFTDRKDPHWGRRKLRRGLDVSLCRPKIRVPGEHLSIWTSRNEPPTGNLVRCIGHEGAPATVTGVASEADVLVPSPEQVHDSLSRHPVGSFAFNQEAIAAMMVVSA